MAKRLRRRACLGGTGGLGLSALSWALGCDSGSTTGRRVSYTLEATSDVAEGTSIHTDLGWRVQIHQGIMGLSQLIFVEGAPVATRWQELLVPQARAHPGHYVGGQVFAELLRPSLVDLTTSSTLAMVQGTTGTIRSAVVGFHDPSEGSLDPRLDDAVVMLSGTAERDAQVVAFTARAAAADVLDEASGLPDVAGCPVEGTNVEGGILRLHFSLGLWLDRVPFDELEDLEGPSPFVPGEAPHNAFVRGLRKALGYSVDHLPA